MPPGPVHRERSLNLQHLTRRQFLQSAGLGLAGLSLAACQPFDTLLQMGRPAPSPTPDRRFASLDERLQKAMADFKIPGMAVGLVRGNRLVYARGYGVRNLDSGEPMTERSVMSMASVSKAFTGTAIMQLVEAGKVDIERPYVEYVPYFEMEDPRYKEITVRHLLAHNSGMPTLTDADFFSEFLDPWDDDGAAERFVRSFKTGVTLNQPPGGFLFMYSDYGYDILADLVHHVSGELFEDYERKHLLRPLAMNDSTFLYKEIKPKDLVAAHVYDPDGKPVVWEHFPYARQHAPSSCLHCSVVDMSHWVLAHLNGGVYQNRRILKPENQARLWEPLLQGEPGYGWGWGMKEAEGEKAVGGIGGQPGVQTTVYMWPRQGLAVIMFCNINGSLSLGAYSKDFSLFDFAEVFALQMLHGEL